MTRRLRALAVARIVIGALVVLRTTPVVGWLHHPMIDPPRILLGWPGEGWTATLGPPLPDTLVCVLCIARTSAAFLFMLGVRPRLTGIVAGIAGLLVYAQEAFGMTHTFRLLYGSSILLAMTDCTAVWSLCRVAARRLASSELLVRAWVTSVYVWASVAKLRPGWWSGLALSLDDADRSFPLPFVRRWLATDHAYVTASTAVLITEVAIAALLLPHRTRRVGIALAVAMQIGFEFAARPDVFGVTMVTLLGVVWVGTPPRRGNARSTVAQESS